MKNPNPNADAIKVLEKMKELLHIGWCQGTAAQDDEGVRRGPCDPDATRWCLVGAAFCATGGEHTNGHNRALARIRRVAERRIPGFCGSLGSFNDYSIFSQDEAIAVVEEAITLEEEA